MKLQFRKAAVIWYIAGVLASAALVAFDQFTKYLAAVYLEPKPIPNLIIIDGVFELYYTTNPGMALGLLPGGHLFFVPLTMVILVGVLIFYVMLPKMRHEAWFRVALILISAGAVGNLIDRVANQYVVDFFYFKLIDFPIFNMADSYVVAGTIVLLFTMMFLSGGRKEKTGNVVEGVILTDDVKKTETPADDPDGQPYE